MRLLPLALLLGCGSRFLDTAQLDTSTAGTAPFPSATGTQSTSDDPCGQQGFAHLSQYSGDDLWLQLTIATADQTCADYASATFYMFVRLDKINDEVACVYTGRTTLVYDAKPDAEDMNTEHSWPQSEGAEVVPAKCDLHHLYPTDSDANATRGNSPFGDVVGFVDWTEGGSTLGADVLGATVFEPRDGHKGNVARSMLYFSARYPSTLTDGQVTLFKQWSALDPVDEAELARTLQIAEEQVLANPLVVCPHLVDAL
jgi:endonuclease I